MLHQIMSLHFADHLRGCSEQEMRFELFSTVKSLAFTGPHLPCSLLSPHIVLPPLHLSFLSNQTLPTPGPGSFLFLEYLPPPQAHRLLNSEYSSTLTLCNASSRWPSLPPKAWSDFPRVFNTLIFLHSSCLLHYIWASQTALRCLVHASKFIGGALGY